MKLLIDDIANFRFVAEATINDIPRYYYLANPPKRVFLVCFDLPISYFVNQVVECSVGNDYGGTLNHVPLTRQLKITLRRFTSNRADQTLSSLIAKDEANNA